MRSTTVAIVAFMIWFASNFSVPAADDKEDDAKRIQGTWVIDPAMFKDVKDQEAAKEALKDAMTVRVIFEGEMMVMKHPPGNEEKVRFRLDPTKKPKQIDFGEGAQGIYELTEDGLRLCWDKEAKTRGRPTKFDLTKEDGSLHVLILKREKK